MVNMVLNVHRSHQAYQVRDKGGREWIEGREREIIYLSLHCHHQNDSCIKIGSDESHFSVSLTVRDKVKRLSTNHNFFEEKGEPKRNRTEALLPASLNGGPNRLTSPFVGRRL